MKVGLLGFDFCSPNKGCEALTYSFVNMLQELIPEEHIDIYNYSYSDCGIFPVVYPNIKFIDKKLHMKNPIYWGKIKSEFNQMDCIFDVTYGDGFSDIYGKVWNANTDLAKQLAIWSDSPLVLLPQTYGPFKNKLLKKWGLSIIKNSNLVLSRDKKSVNEIQNYISKDIVVSTDLAFALPYFKDKYKIDRKKLNIGINISSLLWDEGHNIVLKTDYRKYCEALIEYYVNQEGVSVHLIPHVIDKENYEALENDSRICDYLHKKYVKTHRSPDFENPIDAKSYIANMDVFIGARMHSTIASFSAGVATIPFSYSKKFEGLFGNLNYGYTISGKKLSTQEAINKTKDYIENREKLALDRSKSIKTVDEKITLTKNILSNFIESNLK